MKLYLGLLFLLVFSEFSYANTNRSPEEIFTNIYVNKIWGTNAQGFGSSGPGSTFEKTVSYRTFLQEFLKDYTIRSVVDLGCGDWEFSQHINWQGVDYLGLDIVASLVERNQLRYGAGHINFRYFNALEEELPAADLLICKDILQHLSNADILKILAQCSKYKYCLFTNGASSYAGDTNKDISRGDYRPLDLTKMPFSVKGIKILTYYAGNFLMQTLLIANE